MRKLSFLAASLCLVGSAYAQVFPTTGHAANNFIPFGSGLAGNTPTMDQVFDSSLFAALQGGNPVRITNIAFAPGATGTFNLGMVTILLGYTNAIPGQPSASGGLIMPTQGGGGNNVGAMTTFYSAASSFTFTTVGPNDFQMGFDGLFDYDPNNGNLLVEIVVPDSTNTTLTVSRAAGSSESSRAYNGTRFTNGESPTTATRMMFTTAPVPEPTSLAALGLGALALMRRRKKKAA